MGQVHARVIFTNAREAVLARLGHLQAHQVHHYETEALIDTSATRSVVPPFVADQLGLIRLGRAAALYADGRSEEVDTTEPFLLEIMGRQTSTMAMVLGQHVLLGVTVLEELDLLVDCTHQRLMANPAIQINRCFGCKVYGKTTRMFRKEATLWTHARASCWRNYLPSTGPCYVISLGAVAACCKTLCRARMKPRSTSSCWCCSTA